MPTSDSHQRLLPWLLALAYTIAIITVAWYVPAIWRWLTQSMGTENAGNFVDQIVPVIGIGLLLLVLVRARSLYRRPAALCWIAVVTLGYAYLLTLHAEYPVERIHLIQYSLVAWLYFRALKIDLSNAFAYIGAAIAVLLVGTADEFIQENLIDGRSGTLSDMILDWAAGGLGLVGLLAVQGKTLGRVFARRGTLTRVTASYLLPLAIAGFAFQQIYTRYLYPPLNLLIITVDCARPDRMGLYGYERDTTPYLDKLAGESAIFTNAFSQAAWTGPGVLSTLTGLYPATHGVTHSGKSTLKSVYTLLDAFQERGYRVPNLSYLTVDQNFKNLADFEDTGLDLAKGEVSLIRDWIGKHHREPFAMWYHWRFMHLPYDPPTAHKVFPPASDPDAVPPPIIEKIVQKNVIIPIVGQIFFDERHQPWLDSLYDAQMRQFDSAFESLRYKLALHHILDDTIIVITADHGEELGDHGFVGHASTMVHSRHYDEHLHIPLIIHAPRAFKRGRAIHTLVQQIDILPTVFDMMGWEIPEEIQGRSLLPAIRGEDLPETPVFAESVEGGYQSKGEQRNMFVRSVRTTDWKFIARTLPTGNQFELYNLNDDPKERNNIFEENAEIAAGFIGQLGQWINDNLDTRLALEQKEALLEARVAAMDPANLEVPEIIEPLDGDTLYYETHNGAVNARWTGNPHAAYLIEYDIGEGWHKLRGKYPVEMGTQQVFGPLPRDGWKPLYQWNPYRLRIRPRDLPGGWSDWISINVAPLDRKPSD